MVGTDIAKTGHQCNVRFATGADQSTNIITFQVY